MNDPAMITAAPFAEPSPLRAWCYLVWLSWQRQMRARQMVWIALALLAFSVFFVALNTAQRRWDPHNRPWRYSYYATPTKEIPLDTQQSMRFVGGAAFSAVATNWKTADTARPSVLIANPQIKETADELQGLFWVMPFGMGSQPRGNPIVAAWQLALNQFSLQVNAFVNSVVFFWFLTFLLPLWSMSFATEAMGGDREQNSLIWLLTRPLPRPAIYLAKFVAMLPWSLTLTVGGFWLLCLVGGAPGRATFQLIWPAVLCGALAYSSLFFLFGAFFRRPAIVAIVYTFFLESILGNMPAYLKRVSINFYTRCMMYDALEIHNIRPSRPDIFMPVEGVTACAILLGATLFFLILGMLWFARKEYHEIS